MNILPILVEYLPRLMRDNAMIHITNVENALTVGDCNDYNS